MNDYLKGIQCPYCDGKTELIKKNYHQGNKQYMAFICKPCDAYVGAKKSLKGGSFGSYKALGSVADYNTRYWRIKAHKYFDQLWKRKMKESDITKGKARNLAYSWLSETLGTPKKETHIAMFNIQQCKTVIDICKPYCKDVKFN